MKLFTVDSPNNMETTSHPKSLPSQGPICISTRFPIKLGTENGELLAPLSYTRPRSCIRRFPPQPLGRVSSASGSSFSSHSSDFYFLVYPLETIIYLRYHRRSFIIQDHPTPHEPSKPPQSLRNKSHPLTILQFFHPTGR